MILRKINSARFKKNKHSCLCIHSLVLYIMLFLNSYQANAGVTAIPDAVQPGAQRPDLSEPTELPSTETEEVVDIPAVIDRPLDIDEGERILVNGFELINAEEMPELGILTTEVEELVEMLRLQRQDGFTVGRLQQVANEITSYYRSKGLALAQAVIPMQDVENGIVKIEVYIGYLDRVLVEGNEVYDAKVLEEVFKDLINQPIVKKEIEAALLRLTDYPGLQVYGIFQPGQLIGTADIVLNVQDEKRFDSRFRVDNYGNQETGRIRGRVSIDWNSVFKGPDKLGFLAQQAFSPKESSFYYFDYERYLPYGLLFRGSSSKSDYRVGGEFAEQQITGESTDVSLVMEKSFIRSRTENLSAALSFTRTSSKVERAGLINSREISSVLNFSTQYDVVDDFDLIAFVRPKDSEFESRAINFFSFEISQGLENVLGSFGNSTDVSNLPSDEQPNRVSGSGEFVSGDFTVLYASFTRYQNLSFSQSLLFRSEFQWSDDLLLSQQQYSIGGPNSVRAFSPSFQLVDQAGFMSVEYIFDTPILREITVFENYTLQELLQFSVYYDIAAGKVNDPGQFDEVGWKSYQGIGVGAQFSLPGKFDAKFMSAWPLGVRESVNIDTGNGRAPQIWLNFSISF